jgi:chromosome segregation ATPase
MDQKVKIIIIALIAVLALSFFLTFQAYLSKQAVTKERDALKVDNDSLVKKANDALQQRQQLQNRIDALNANLDKITKEKDEIQNKFDLVNKEKADLVEQIKTLKSRKIQTAQAMSAPSSLQAAAVPADAYWAGILKAKTDLELQVQNIRQELRTMQINSEQLQKEKNSLLLEVNSLERDKADLARQIEYNQKLMDSMSAELVAEKNDKFQIQASSKSLKEENKFLRRQLKALNSHKVDLDRKLASLKDKNDALSTQLSEMESMLKERITKAGAAVKQQAQPKEAQVSSAAKKESVELSPIVVRPQKSNEAAQQVAATLSGKVLAINRDNNFIIVDIGEEDGVKIGNTFTVYRQNQPIAEVGVIQARKDISACDIKKESVPIKLGDTVK